MVLVMEETWILVAIDPSGGRIFYDEDRHWTYSGFPRYFSSFSAAVIARDKLRYPSLVLIERIA